LTAEIGLRSPGEVNKVGERNCLLLTYQEEGDETIYGLVVDCGQKIPTGSRDTRDQHHDDRLASQYCPDFTQMEGITIVGVLISHKHRDHVGALEEFLRIYDVPVVCSLSTLNFIKWGLLRGETGSLKGITDKNVKLGPFEVTSFPVLHSTDGCLGFVISAGGVNVFYSGDIKIPATLHPDEAVPDGYKMYTRELQAVGRIGIDYMVLDSTNADEQGYAGIEEDVVPVIEDIIRENARGRVFLSLLSSNEERERNIIAQARRQGRAVYVAGSSLQRMLRIAGVGRWTPLYYRTAEDMPEDCVVLCTGCQGEPKSFLDKLAMGALGYPLDIGPLDVLALLSDTIPLPEIETQVQEMTEGLSGPGFFRKIYLTPATPHMTSRGADIVYVEGHVSGHGKEEDLRTVLRFIKPRYLIAYHGTPEKKGRLAEIAARSGIPVFELAEGVTLSLPRLYGELQKARQA